jgi:predicted ATPase
VPQVGNRTSGAPAFVAAAFTTSAARFRATGRRFSPVKIRPGESFIDIALARFRSAGFYLLDEPESALSLVGQLSLLRIIHDSCSIGSQFLIATHSPLLMAVPGATIIEPRRARRPSV